jgi:hypothetical protein
MHLQRGIAVKPNWPERPCSAVDSGVIGNNSIQVRYIHGARRLGPFEESQRPRVLQLYLLFPIPSTTSRGQTKQAVLSPEALAVPARLALFNIPYSGVYLFQFARHVALLLKTSSALPAHHCIRQASRPQGWLPRAFLPFPSLPTAARTARADCTDGSLMIKLVGGPATVYAMKGSPTSCQVVLQPSAIKRVARRDSPMHSNTVVVRGKGATLSTLVL